MKRISAGLRIFAAAGLGLVLLLQPAPAAIDVDKVPNPLAAAHQWVGDNAGVLGPEYAALIHSACEALKAKTGAECAVITVDDLGGLSVEDFAARLFQRFGIGEAGKENGLLLLFSRNDRKVRLEVGYGLEEAVPDSLAGRILEEQALPFFREGRYGRGLYAAVRKTVETAAAAAGATLGLEDPAAWPAQPPPPQPAAADIRAPSPAGKKVKPDPLPSALIGAAAVLLFMILGGVRVARRVAAKRGKAAKMKAARGADNVSALAWTGSAAAGLVLAVVNKSFLPYLAAFGLAPAVGSFIQGRALQGLRRKIAGHREPCSKCGRPMDLLDEQADDAFLSAEEAAEEKAGGMDYEVWQCGSCGTSESFAMTLGKAAACPRCGRRTLVTATTTLVAATRAAGGKVKIEADCRNPNCDYRKVTERSTPRLPPPPPPGRSFSSGHGSFGSSGRSSFGGGRSGGGGASKGW